VFWGFTEFVKLVGDWQHDSGDRPRAGFSSGVLMALHHLETAHDMEFPHLTQKESNVWNMGNV
jgi:hypothetical protein